MQKSAGGVLLPKSAVKFERYLMGEVSFMHIIYSFGQIGDAYDGIRYPFDD